MWLGITQNLLFNRLRTEGDHVFPIGWAQVVQRASNTHYVIDAMALAGQNLTHQNLAKQAIFTPQNLAGIRQ